MSAHAQPRPGLPAAIPDPGAPLGGPRRRRVSTARRVAHTRGLASGLLAACGIAGVALLGTGVHYTPFDTPAVASAEPAAALRRERDRLRTELRRLTPRGAWLVIDQTHNRLRLMRGERLELQAPCSAGSGMVLRERAGGRMWTFDTPRGAFRIRSRLANPVWRKPDWAFLEEGRPIPDDPSERFEYGVLGAYALYFGDGYMVHGTLYERLIGRPVSHGCVRVGREPLRRLWKALPLGAPIYIF